MTITLDTICKISDSFEVNAVAFSPDGKRIATGGCSSAEVSVWDIEQNKRITSCKLEYSNMPTDSVCWSASNLLASMQNGGTGIRVWDGDSFELIITINLRDDYGAAKSIAFDPSGKYLMAACAVPMGERAHDLVIFDTQTWMKTEFKTGMKLNNAAWVDGKVVAVGRRRKGCSEMIVIEPISGAMQVFPVESAIGKEVVVGSVYRLISLQGGAGLVINSANSGVSVLHMVDLIQGTVVNETVLGEYACEGLVRILGNSLVVALFDGSVTQPLHLIDGNAQLIQKVNYHADYVCGGLAASVDGRTLAISSGNQVTVFGVSVVEEA